MRSPARRQSVNVILTQSMPVHPLKSEQKLGEHAATGGLRGHRALATVGWGPYLIERQWGTLNVEQRSRSGIGTNRNCQDPHGISGAEGRPAVPSAWRRQPPLTPEPTFTKTQSRGSGWVERLSASVFFSMTATRRFRPSTQDRRRGRGQ